MLVEYSLIFQASGIRGDASVLNTLSEITILLVCLIESDDF